MLSLEQIMELQEKGFTYDQLQVLNNMNLGAKPTAPEPDAPTPVAPAAPEPDAPTPVAPAAQEPDTARELNKKIDELTATVKAMQAQNIKQAEQDAPKALTSEDVIKSFMEAS